MVFMFLRKGILLASRSNFHFLSRAVGSHIIKGFVSSPSKEDDALQSTTTSFSDCSPGVVYLSPMFSNSNSNSAAYDIELVDDDAWQVSSGLAQAWRETDSSIASGSSFSVKELMDHEPVDYCSLGNENEPDFEDIDNMRIHGHLFYKLDRNSMEFEEYSLEFHRRKSSKKVDGRNENNKKERKDNASRDIVPKAKKHCEVSEFVSSRIDAYPSDETYGSYVGNKKQRTPTFNQLTAPYHEPFCLDIFISKASVRACIVHRVTSKVVAVAHSISKDMKFDLDSTRNSTACAAVGQVLAQRALEDDIHDVVYTPRKGEKVEGKLELVLQSIIDNGINVKVKLKQRRPKYADQQIIT